MRFPYTYSAVIVLVLFASLGAAATQSPRPLDPTAPLTLTPAPSPIDAQLMKIRASFALQATQQPSAAQEGYVPADQLPKPQDTLPAAPLLATAYAFVWLLLFGYVFSIWRRLANVEREMHSVGRRIGPSGGRVP